MMTLAYSESFLDFKKRLDSIDQNTSYEDKRRIHYKSLKNFIYHYAYLKKSRVSAAKLLVEYLELIESSGYFLTEEQSQGTYDLYINPIARIYRRYLNFASEFSILFNILFYVLPNMGVWFIFHSNILTLSFQLLYILYWINYIIKYYANKIYGYRY